MSLIDLSTPPTPPLDVLDGLPRRATLTLPELRLAAERAGGAPLPFDVAADSRTPSPLDDRLGASTSTRESAAYAAALDALHDPFESLIRRGLIARGALDPGVAGAIGLIATPRVALDLDIACGPTRVKAWHRQANGAVASLATADGLVFELAWYSPAQWTSELARAAVLPEDATLADSVVPRLLRLPFSLVDAAGEALRAGRADLVSVLIEQHARQVGVPADPAAIEAALAGLFAETRGRLRALVTDVGRGDAAPVGVIAWVLLADGWHAVRATAGEDGQWAEVRKVEADDLASELAPVLAEVSR